MSGREPEGKKVRWASRRTRGRARHPDRGPVDCGNGFPRRGRGSDAVQGARRAGITVNIVREANDGYWDNVWLKKPFSACDWFGRPTMDWLFSTSCTSDVPRIRRGLYRERQQLIHDEGGVMIVAFSNWRNGLSNKIGHGEVGGQIPSDNMRMTERWWMMS